MNDFYINQRLVKLYHKLKAQNPSFRVTIAALNIALEQGGQRIITKEDFERFIEQVETFEE